MLLGDKNLMASRPLICNAVEQTRKPVPESDYR